MIAMLAALAPLASTASMTAKPASHSLRPDPQSFDIFWHAFRAAALANDTAKLSAMTHFPLTVRGELDDSAVRRIDATKFAGVFRKVMAQDTGLSLQPQTQRALIRTKTVATKREFDVAADPSSARVGYMEFGRANGRWRLTTVFLADAS